MYQILLILMLILAQTSPQVTVATDRGWYAPGDQVQITVSTSGFEGNETLSLWLYLDEPDGHCVFFVDLPTSGAVMNFTLPQDAADGMYTVTVMWGHRYVATGFMVQTQPIPEFPLGATVALLLIAIMAVKIIVHERGKECVTVSVKASRFASPPST